MIQSFSIMAHPLSLKELKQKHDDDNDNDDNDKDTDDYKLHCGDLHFQPSLIPRVLIMSGNQTGIQITEDQNDNHNM